MSELEELNEEYDDNPFDLGEDLDEEEEI